MSKLLWDAAGERLYETGVDHGVLYVRNNVGDYPLGVAWNGLVTVTEAPTGADANPLYADNVKYLNLIAAEQFDATIDCYTYPDEWAACDGSAVLEGGIAIGQQTRKSFGFVYRTQVGNDIEGTDYGYKLHLVYGANAAPSQKAHGTVNDKPDAITFSYAISTIPVTVGTIDSVDYKPTATLTIDSTKVDATALLALEAVLFGTDGEDPRLPLPAEVISMFSGTLTTVVPAQPAFNSGTHTITIPTVAGVEYRINDEVVAAGAVVITEDTVVTARPTAGHEFPAVSDDDWYYHFV